MQKHTLIKVVIDSNLSLAFSLDWLGNFEEALRMYDHALEINPNDANTYSNKGNKFKFVF